MPSKTTCFHAHISAGRIRYRPRARNVSDGKPVTDKKPLRIQDSIPFESPNGTKATIVLIAATDGGIDAEVRWWDPERRPSKRDMRRVQELVDDWMAAN